LCDKLLLKTDVSFCTYFIIILAIINALLPMDDINEKLFPVGEDQPLTKSYEEA